MTKKQIKSMGSEINERIRDLMRIKNISQREMAAALDLSQPALYQRLNSDKTFPIEDLINLAKFAEVNISDVVYEIREPDEKNEREQFEELKSFIQDHEREILKRIEAGQNLGLERDVQLIKDQAKIATEYSPDGIMYEIADTLKSILAELKAKK